MLTFSSPHKSPESVFLLTDLCKTEEEGQSNKIKIYIHIIIYIYIYIERFRRTLVAQKMYMYEQALVNVKSCFDCFHSWILRGAQPTINFHERHRVHSTLYFWYQVLVQVLIARSTEYVLTLKNVDNLFLFYRFR